MKPPFSLVLWTTLLVAPVVASAQHRPFSIEGLVITASPTPRVVGAIASHVTILTEEDLRAQGSRALSEVLRDVAGLDVVRNGSFGALTSVFLRGGESDYTLVLVDGVQVNQAGGGFDFASLTADNVERVEIVRGPTSALYGSDAVTGVIQIVTRTGRGAPQGRVKLETGSFGSQNWGAEFLAGTDRAGYALSVTRRSSDGILAFNNGHVSTVVSGRARLLPDDRTAVGVTVRVTGREYHYPTDGSGAVVDRNAFTFSDATTAQVTVSRTLSNRLSLEVLVGLHEIDGGTDDAQDGPADTLGLYGFTSLEHFRRATGEARLHFYLDEAVLTGGFEAEVETQRSFSESASQIGPSHGRSASGRSNRAGFLHASVEAGPLSLSAGGRVEDNERFGRMATWQAGLSWLVPGGRDTRFRASVGRAIKEPTFFENFATGFAIGNPELDPERARSWEVGLEEVLFGGSVRARATYFDQRFEDLIQYTFVTPTPSDPNFFNVAAATSRGLELELSGHVEGFAGAITGTWLDTEVTDSGFDDGPGATFVTGERLLRRPDQSWALLGSAEVGLRTRVFARLAIIGSRADRDFSTFPATPVDLPRYELLSLGGEWDVTERGDGISRLRVTLRVENLLGTTYEEALGFRAPGRGLYVGANVAVGGGG